MCVQNHVDWRLRKGMWKYLMTPCAECLQPPQVWLQSFSHRECVVCTGSMGDESSQQRDWLGSSPHNDPKNLIESCHFLTAEKMVSRETSLLMFLLLLWLILLLSPRLSLSFLLFLLFLMFLLFLLFLFFVVLAFFLFFTVFLLFLLLLILLVLPAVLASYCSFCCSFS